MPQGWLAKMTKTREMRTKLQNHGELRRFVIGAVRCVKPCALLGAATGLVAHFRCGLWGWLANVHYRLQARLARLCRSHRSSSDRRTTDVSPHHTMTCTDVGGRVTDGAGSSVAVEWSDRARTVALQPLSGWCGCVYKPGWLWPLRMAKRVSKRATRGGERQSTEAPGHRIRAPRPERSVRSVWTRRACFPGACGPGGSSAR